MLWSSWPWPGYLLDVIALLAGRTAKLWQSSVGLKNPNPLIRLGLLMTVPHIAQLGPVLCARCGSIYSCLAQPVQVVSYYGSEVAFECLSFVLYAAKIVFHWHTVQSWRRSFVNFQIWC